MGKQKSSRQNESRKKAEKRPAESGGEISVIPVGKDVEEAGQELSVYRVELEMPNDALRGAQREIEESHARYLDLYENAPVGYLTFDEKGVVLDMNLTASALLGIERSSLVKKPFSPLIVPESQDVFHLHRRQVLDSGLKKTCELILKRNNPEENLFHAQLDSIARQAKGVTAIRTILTDITERKRAEGELQTTHQDLEKRVAERTAELQADIAHRKHTENALKERLEFETLLADLSARFVNLPSDRIDSEITGAQRRICEFIDLDRSSLGQVSEQAPEAVLLTHLHQPSGDPPTPRQMNMWDYFPWSVQKVFSGQTIVITRMSDLPPEAGRDRENYSLYGTKSVVIVPLSSGGRPILGFLTFAVIREERGWPETVVRGFQLIAQVFANALARKRADEALRESEERLELASTSAGVGLWILNVSTGKFWATEKALQLFGLPSDHVLSFEAFLNLVEPADRQRVLEAVNRALRSDDDMRIEYRIVVNNGVRWVGSRGRRQLSSAGGVERLTGVSTDITKRKLGEAELEERLRFEKLLSDTSAKLAKVTGDRVDQEIMEGLHSLVEFMHVDRCALVSIPHGKQMWRIAYEAHIDGFSALPTNTDLSPLLFPYVGGKMAEKPAFWGFASLADLPTEAHTDRKTYREWGIRSMSHVLVEVGGSVDYYMCMAGAPKELVPDGEYAARLRLIGEIFVNAIERGRAEKELQTRETMLASVMSASPVGIALATSDRIIRWVNEAVTHITGYRPDELTGQSSRMLYQTEEEFLRVGEMIDSHPEGGWFLNAKWVRKDGVVRNVEVRAAWVDLRDVSAGIVLVAQDITERLGAEAAAAEVQSTMTAVLESTEDMIWTVDPKRFGLLTFNSALRENLRGTGLTITHGMSPEDMIGGGFTPDVAAKWRALYERALREGPYSQEYSAHTSSKTFLLSFSPVKRDDRIFGISVFAKDITEHKRDEEALRESGEKYRAVVEQANDGIIIVQDGIIVYANPRMAELHGSSVELLVSSRFTDHVDSGDVTKLTEMKARIMAGEAVPSLYEARLKRVDGSIAPAELNVGAITYRGRKAGIVIIRDISERKRMEQSIRMAAEEWRSTFDAVSDAVVILDRECRIVRANRAALSFISKSAEDVVGSPCCTLMHGAARWDLGEACPVAVMLKTKQHEEVEVFDEGRQRWLCISADPVLEESGEVSRIIHRVRDITERKRADMETFGAHREMLRLERLLLMGELSASLAHELNQPLTSILSNARAAARLLEADRLTVEELKMILDDIVRDDKRAGDIIRSLRSMLKRDEDEVEITQTSGLLNGAIALFSSEAILRNIVVKTDIPASLPLSRVNRVQIQQVVVNLMMNAAEAMEDQPVSKRRLIIRAAVINVNSVIRVSISDSGYGIDEADKKRLFEPFFTTKASGLGMGLPLSRAIVEAHGGHIWAENRKHGGAVFFFDLPIWRQ